MSSHCSARRKATVDLLFDDGNKETIISNNPPVEIQFTNTGNSQRVVTYSGLVGVPCYVHPAYARAIPPSVWVWSSYLASPKPNQAEIETFTVSFQAVAGQQFHLSVAIDDYGDIFFNGQLINISTTYNIISGATLIGRQGRNTLVFVCTNRPDGSTDPMRNPGGLMFVVTTSISQCQVKINDSSGIIFDGIYPSCPEYEVICDDDCPTGFCKCITPGYPGYCCLPCSNMKSGIIEVAQNLF